jgi:predicted nucleotide-binding protein
MNKEQTINQLDALSERVMASDGDLMELEDTKRETFVVIKHYFGGSSIYLSMLNDIKFPLDEEGHEKDTKDMIQRYLQLTDTILTELKSEKNEPLKSIFIVHGTDYQSVKELKAILLEVGITPIILHEQPSKGMTIIEKLEEYSKVDFAFIILTPDDNAFGKYEWFSALRTYFKKIDASVDEIRDKLNNLKVKEIVALNPIYNDLHKDRARQNVILEFGYFIGRLGRQKVCCLYQGDIELPSDMHGICYLHFNNSVYEVKDTIIGELKAADIVG